jgi:hypothetical protein
MCEEELSSANTLNKLGSHLFPRASSEEYSPVDDALIFDLVRPKAST